VSSQSGRCLFTVRKVCVYSKEGVCLQSESSVFTVRKVCVRSKEGVCLQ